jgi:hypothetical protein
MSVAPPLERDTLTTRRLVAAFIASVLFAACGGGNAASSQQPVVVVTLGEASPPRSSCSDGTPWHGACVSKPVPCVAGPTVGATACVPVVTAPAAPARADVTVPDPAPAELAPMAVPGPLAFACNDDAPCGTHRCNAQYGKCAFPCQSASDCQAPGQCLAGLCIPPP